MSDRYEERVKRLRDDFGCIDLHVIEEFGEVVQMLREVAEEAQRDRDLEWFQIIESFSGFHPVSMTDALDRGILWAKKHNRAGETEKESR